MKTHQTTLLEVSIRRLSAAVVAAVLACGWSARTSWGDEHPKGATIVLLPALISLAATWLVKPEVSRV